MDQYSTVNATNSRATQWSVPEIVQSANTLASEPDSNGSIILLDDLHRMPMAVLPYMYELLLERKVGQYKLHSKVAIVATMNDSDDAGFSGMDSPIRNRLAILEVDFSFDEWFKQHGINYHHYVSSFLKNNPSFVQEDESTGIEGFGTPRAYEFLSETLHSLELPFISEHIQTLAKQYISVEASQALAKHVKYIEAINFENIVKSRTLTDTNKLEPLDVLLYSYITHYIHTPEDGAYLMDLLDHNINSSIFIGFSIGNLYNIYLQHEAGKPTSEGLLYVVAKLLQKPLSDYDLKVSTKLKEKEFVNSDKLLSAAHDYIL